MEKIREKFSQIEDKRNESYIEHNLADILILVMGAVVSGVTELADMMVYFASKKDFYKEQYKVYPLSRTI